MKITMELPDTPRLSQLGEAHLREALVATLYHVREYSEKEACDALGITRREFEELLPKYGFSVLGDDAETLAAETRA